jgi:hypothetical protein
MASDASGSVSDGSSNNVSLTGDRENEPQASLPRNERESLAREVYAALGHPIDSWQIAATLESMGIRDIDAYEQFGKENVFELAADIQGLVEGRRGIAEDRRAAPQRKSRRTGTLRRIFRFYGKGTLTALPIMGQIASILLLRYSLWAWVDFTEAQATVVALGTLLSFIITGGFIQSISREGIRYIGNKNYFLAEKICWKLVGYGTMTALLVGCAIFCLNLLMPFYEVKLALISLTYYVLLSELWLYSSVAFVLNRPFAVFVILTAGVGPVFLIMEFTSLGIYVAHWLGLAFAVLLMMLFTMMDFHSLARLTKGDLKLGRLPSLPVRAYLVAPYFAYGFLYFFNLFLDRIVSWSAPNPELPPYIVWFRTPYELGMDWALISLMLTLALLEYVIHEFTRYQLPVQKAVKCFRLDRYRGFFKKFYAKFLYILLGIGLLDILLTYAGVLCFRQFSYVKEIGDFFSSQITFFTFYAASVGYFFIAVGLYNSLFFFTLSRPEFVLRSILPAIAVNLVVALVASRWINYQSGVLGLVAGGITFAFLSWHYARRFFRELDYYYYAAY